MTGLSAFQSFIIPGFRSPARQDSSRQENLSISDHYCVGEVSVIGKPDSD
jgi:hypothetical protein